MQTLIIFLFGCLFVQSLAIQCKNEQNEDVDWYVIYKFPKIKESADLNIKNGFGYSFLTSGNYHAWTVSTKSINASDSMVALTVRPFYQNQSSLAYVLYNDEPPNAPSKDAKGHTKGLILSDAKAALWLVHSVPHFIPLEPAYSYPATGVKNGQSFLCISLNLDNLNKVGIQLQYNEPQIYAFGIPKRLAPSITEIVRVASGKTIDQPPWYKKAELEDYSGAKFVSFAKSRKFGGDLYEDWLLSQFDGDLLVETWQDGSGKMPSNCSKQFKVYNVKSISFDVDPYNLTFHSTRDHSKWAISAAWVCIGDINRMDHQKARGGGTVCFHNSTVAKNYKNLIESIEECNNLF